MKPTFLLIALCFLAASQSTAQNVYIHTVDNQTHTYQLIDVTSITFDENVMNLNLITEDTVSWNFSQIAYYNYDQWYVSVPEGQVLGENGIKVYPNPTSDYFTVEYELAARADISLSIIDMQGRVLIELPAQESNAGLQQLRINVSDLGRVSGSYLVRLVSGKSVFNKLIIIDA